MPEQGPEPWAYVQFATAGLNSGFPGDSEVKASACNAGDLGSILGLGRSPGEGNGNPLQCPLMAQSVKNLPLMQETPVRFLGQEDPLEKG